MCDLPGFGASLPLRGEATIPAYADFLLRLSRAVSPKRRIGVVAHSLSATLAVEAALQSPQEIGALLSIEGNLTPDDAYFSGRAAAYDNSDQFKHALADAIGAIAQQEPAVWRYHGAVCASDAPTMWRLGRDAVLRGAENAFGHAYLRLGECGVSTLLLWGRKNMSAAAATFIDQHRPPNCEFTVSGHWKSIDAPEDTSAIALEFFGRALAP